MQNKTKQITDSIHGTIYISAIEHQMMSTPFFYRLNDVYQSSTVYMTFPSNRTKRYEHSLGTMNLAGRMFYSAITNASKEDKQEFLDCLLEQFLVVLNAFKDRNRLNDLKFYRNSDDNLSKLIPKRGCEEDKFITLINDAFKEGFSFDNALCKQEVCFFDLLPIDDNSAIKKIPLYSFLYQSALEALRIAALFHDIGHPPFSHIIEFTLQRLYCNKDSSNFIESKAKKFVESLKKYVDCNSIEEMLLYSEEEKNIDPALHEQIGLDILYNAFRGVMKTLTDEWGKNSSCKFNRVNALYLVTVIEFTFGILLEKSSVFESIHRLIDGPIDADRLDYVVRDSHNSGVDWGMIPYERLISSLKFVKTDNHFFCIAFPEKVTDDLDDLIVNRYKVFQRINYHHKTVKTSELLQRSVEALAKDYLSSKDGKEITPEIKDLWCPLGSAFGQSEVENQIGKWTDSWLISVLNNALIRLSDSDERASLVDNAIGRTEEYLESIYVMLEEVLLNRKRFFPLLKRHRDAITLKDDIQQKAKINDTALQKLVSHEYNKLIQETDERSSSAQESLYRINLLQEHIFKVAELGLLDLFFCGTKSCKEIIKEKLEGAQKNGLINNYFLWSNQGLTKLGISDKPKIYLYKAKGAAYEYDINTTLKRKLLAQRAGSLWLYVYVSLPELTDAEVDRRISNLSNEISDAIGKSLSVALDDLFDFSNITKK